MKTREQWVEEVMEQADKYALDRVDCEYGNTDRDKWVNSYKKLRAILLEVPDPELTTCRHCGFRVKLNEAPQPEYKDESCK